MQPADIVETFRDGRFRVAWGDILPSPVQSRQDFELLKPGGLLASGLPDWWPRLYCRTKVNRQTGCWECPHNLSRSRYSHISIDGRTVQVHRLGYRTLRVG